MKVLAKLNILVVTFLGTGMICLAWMSHQFLTGNARDQVAQQAEMMMESARGVRNYTSREVKPLIEKLPLHTRKFLPQIVPAYAAMATLGQLKAMYPDFTYKEAALNPTNLRDRASDWEGDVIAHFRKNANRTQYVGERETPTGRVLFLAKPIRAEHECLQCHGIPETAPLQVVRSYGASNGFRWTEGEVVAAQIVSVPMALPVKLARAAFQKLVCYLAGLFILAIVLIDAAVFSMVILPLRNLATLTDQISRGRLEELNLRVRGNDEIAIVSCAFNRMHANLRKAATILGRESHKESEALAWTRPA